MATSVATFIVTHCLTLSHQKYLQKRTEASNVSELECKEAIWKFQLSEWLPLLFSSSSSIHSTTSSTAAAGAAAFALFIEEEVLECLLQVQVLRCMLFPSCALLLVLDAGEHLHMLRQQAPPVFEYPRCIAETRLRRDSRYSDRHDISSHNR